MYVTCQTAGARVDGGGRAAGAAVGGRARVPARRRVGRPERAGAGRGAHRARHAAGRAGHGRQQDYHHRSLDYIILRIICSLICSASTVSNMCVVIYVLQA